ncbi:MAG: endolytic transglycosylase MltG [Betaproteobacteria bacterium]|nr:endolytic transglycosylase MltG [Betaproteobacteria bacterium]
MNTFIRLFFLGIFLALCACAFVGYDAWRFLHTPPATPGEEQLFDVESGTSFGKIAEQLEKKGLVTDAKKLVLLARYKKWDSRLQSGRFQLHSGWLPEHILDQLVNGQPMLYRVTLREGLTWWEVARVLEQAGFAHTDDFRAVIFDPEFLRHYGIPFYNAEGFLYPDTYLLKKPENPDLAAARAVAGRLVDTFWQKTARIWPDGKTPNARELRKLVILASIVEKESAVSEELPRIAGVYAKRLSINMPLQADPTVIYGLGPKFDGNLRRVHLEDPNNLYNTYKIPGLPPGPICSPGLSALKAAVAPEEHAYLYFVAKGDGGHVFSTKLNDHNRAVRQWVQIQREQQRQKENTP